MSQTSSWGCCDLTSTAVTLRSADNAHSVCVHFFGATVTSWVHGARGEQLFLSSKSKFNQVKAIRGGIPVVFPQFGRPSEAMSQHGFARTSVWSLGKVTSTDSSCSVELQLDSSVETLAQWSHPFRLKYLVVLSAEGLMCTLSATNTGYSSFSCHTLLHTYFRVPHISQVKVSGFQGLEYTDKVLGGALFSTTEKSVSFDAEVDRVYLNPSATAHSSEYTGAQIPDIFIEDSATGAVIMQVKKSAVISHNDGDQIVEADCVLWNQWRDGSLGMADMDDDGYEHYVCVEPGTVSDLVTVPAHATLILTQNLLPGGAGL